MIIIYGIHGIKISVMLSLRKSLTIIRLKALCFCVQLQASNEDGTSPWSDVVQYRTLCDRPRPPSKPQTKGKLYPDSFRVVWGLYSRDSMSNIICFGSFGSWTDLVSLLILLFFLFLLRQHSLKTPKALLFLIGLGWNLAEMFFK